MVTGQDRNFVVTIPRPWRTRLLSLTPWRSRDTYRFKAKLVDYDTYTATAVYEKADGRQFTIALETAQAIRDDDHETPRRANHAIMPRWLWGDTRDGNRDDR